MRETPRVIQLQIAHHQNSRTSRFKIFKIQEVYRIGHVNPTLHYVRKSKDAQIVAVSLFHTFSKNVTKTCPKPVKNGIPERACVKA